MELYSRQIWEDTQPSDLWRNNCPFCEENLDFDYVMHETKHWRVIHNKFPILWLKKHIMAIPKVHITAAWEIPAEVMSDYPLVEKFVCDFFNWESYFTFMRESIQNRSLEHIHYHFVPWKINYNHLEYILLEQGFTNQLASK